MKKNLITYILFFSLCMLTFAYNAFAELNIQGVLGVDLNTIGSSSLSNNNSYSKVNASRYISNHYLKLKNSGVIKSENFANYSINTSFNGYFNSTNTRTINNSFYRSPIMNNFNSDIMFFPNRTYPVNLFYLKAKDVTLKFNENNRSKTDILSPGLAVLQKNKVDNEKYGTAFQSVLFKDATLTGDYIKSNSKNLYLYEFDEHRSIYIKSTELAGDIFSSTVRVMLRNNISDDSVRIVSGLIDEVIQPQATLSIDFEIGDHRIDVIPFNHYTQSHIDMRLGNGQFFIVDIEADEFPAQTDNIRESTDSKFLFSLNKDQFKLKTEYTYEDFALPVINSQETANLLKNIINYDLTRKLNIVFNTEKNKRDNTTGLSERQIVNTIKNSSTLSFIQRKGLIGNIRHEYLNEENDKTNGEIDKTKNSTIASSLTLPSVKYEHKISLNTKLSNQDKTGEIDAKTTTQNYDLTNTMKLFYKGYKIVPFNSTKLDIRNIDTDTTKSTTKDFNVTSSIEASKENTRYLGDVVTKIKYTYAKNTDDISTKISNTMAYDLGLIKQITEKSNFSFSTSLQLKTFGESGFVAVDSTTPPPEPKPSQFTSSLTFSYLSTQWQNFNFTTSLMLSNSPGSKSTNMALTVDAKLPYIKLPLKSEIVNQIRNLEGLPKQTSFNATTSTNYSFSQMNLTISHIYSKEKLVLDTYTFYEFKINVSRRFGL